MSISNDVQVMQAKLSGNTPALQAMAAQGSMAAMLALKELLDGQQYAQQLKANANLQSPEMDPVLSQMTGRLQETEAEPARGYADGGTARVGYTWEQNKNTTPLERLNYANMARRGQLMEGKVTPRDVALAQRDTGDFSLSPKVKDFFSGLGRGAQQVFSQLTQNPNYSIEGRNYPAPKVPPLATPNSQARMLRQQGAGDGVVDGGAPTPAKAGLAAAVGGGGGGAKASSPVATTDAGPVPPVTILPRPAADASQDELDAYAEQRAALAKERSGLTERQRKMLDDQYAAQTKALTPAKGQQFWDYLANVAAAGGRSALQAGARGAIATRNSEKQRIADLTAAQNAYMEKQILLDKADLAERSGDVDKAFALRQEADKIKWGHKKDEKTMEVQDANIAQSGAAVKNSEAQSRKADRWTPSVGRAGSADTIKPMTEGARVSAIQRQAAALLKADPDMMPQVAIRQATQMIDSLKPGAVPAPAAHSGKVLDFNAL